MVNLPVNSIELESNNHPDVDYQIHYQVIQDFFMRQKRGLSKP